MWEQKNPIYKDQDYYVIKSRYSEAGPLILGECKATGTPILSSNIGALKDLLPEELRGLNPDSPRSLSIKLKEISLNQEKLEKYKRLVKSIHMPTWHEIGNEVNEFYNTIRDSRI